MKTLLTLLVSATLATLPSGAQTCKIWCGVSKQGVSHYKEVYEYDYVTVKPEYPGGRSSLLKHINKTRHYPASAYRKGIEGRVSVSFIVNADGSVSNLSVLRGVNPALNEEALRVFSAMPDWHPGKLNGKAVPVRVIESIVFRK